jgi:hypothetical protein
MPYGERLEPGRVRPSGMNCMNGRQPSAPRREPAVRGWKSTENGVKGRYLPTITIVNESGSI